MRNRLLPPVLLVLILMTGSVCAQHDLTMYYMETLPQRNTVNPAFIPVQGGWLGLPGISGFSTGTSLPFSYDQIFSRDGDDSIVFHADQLIDKLYKQDRVRLNTTANLFAFGSHTRNGQLYFEFAIRSRVSQETLLPAQLVRMLWYGNHDPEIFGKHIGISPRINAVAYDEFGLTVAGYAMQKRLTWGVKVKYLSGRFNITSAKTEFDFYTNPDTYEIALKTDLEFLTSGLDSVDNYFNQSVFNQVFPGNHGYGFDLGATFQINRNFSVNASVVDIGAITWRKNNLKMVSHEPGKTFRFDGLTLADFVDLFDDPDQFARKVEDSLRALIRIDSVYDVTYTSRLPMRFFVGGTWMPAPNHRISLLFNGTSWDQDFHGALSMGYNYTLRRLGELHVSYNIFNRQYFNIGTGFTIHAGPIQVYAMTDNLPGLVFYRQSNNYSFQFGINILLNRNRGITEMPTETPAPSE